MSDAVSILYPKEDIARRVEELGSEVAGAFGSEEICILGVMKGCLVFMADMMRAIPLEMSCHFLRTSSMLEAGEGSLRTDIVYTTDVPYEGRHILLLDDVIDTGITLSFLLDHIWEKNPRSLKVCTLIDKPGERKIAVEPDWAAFTLKEPLERFIVGYGLDCDERYRGLPYLGTIPRRVPPAEGRKITLSSQS